MALYSAAYGWACCGVFAVHPVYYWLIYYFLHMSSFDTKEAHTQCSLHLPWPSSFPYLSLLAVILTSCSFPMFPHSQSAPSCITSTQITSPSRHQSLVRPPHLPLWLPLHPPLHSSAWPICPCQVFSREEARGLKLMASLHRACELSSSWQTWLVAG